MGHQPHRHGGVLRRVGGSLQPWLADHRDEVFLATKTGDGEATRARRARTVARAHGRRPRRPRSSCTTSSSPTSGTSPSGPAAPSRRWPGPRRGARAPHRVTGHGLRIAEMHLRSLERFPFDCRAVPYNHSLLRAGVPADGEALRRALRRRTASAVQTIKSIARGRWRRGRRAALQLVRAADRPGAIGRAVRFVLSDRDCSSTRRAMPGSCRCWSWRPQAVRPAGRRRAGRRRRGVGIARSSTAGHGRM